MTSSQIQTTVESSNLENTHDSDEDNLPFAFARRYGVMVTQSDVHTLSLISYKTLAPAVLLEIQRHFQKSPSIKMVAHDEFDALLQQSYETQTQQRTMESYDDELDLSGVAEALPEPEDLLEAEDDAPIIRLI
ncbi:MAG: type II secretion system protein GspE, partial [Gammaproteobacteria bacterium]|nr:type II secretion system protein GspE [Gammaproteobacteria bacterium]